jgi:hypothetical protein
MHRRPMVRREDYRPVGGAGNSPGLVPSSSTGLDSGSVFARCQSKNRGRQTQKAQLSGNPGQLGKRTDKDFLTVAPVSRQIHNPPQCCLNPLIPADAVRSRSGFDLLPQIRRQANGIRLLLRPEIRLPASPSPCPATGFALCAHCVTLQKTPCPVGQGWFTLRTLHPSTTRSRSAFPGSFQTDSRRHNPPPESRVRLPQALTR